MDLVIKNVSWLMCLVAISGCQIIGNGDSSIVYSRDLSGGDFQPFFRKVDGNLFEDVDVDYDKKVGGYRNPGNCQYFGLRVLAFGIESQIPYLTRVDESVKLDDPLFGRVVFELDAGMFSDAVKKQKTLKLRLDGLSKERAGVETQLVVLRRSGEKYSGSISYARRGRYLLSPYTRREGRMVAMVESGIQLDVEIGSDGKSTVTVVDGGGEER